MLDAMTLYRTGRWCRLRGIPAFPRLMEALTFFLFSSVVPVSAEIGAGSRLGYRGIGVVIHARAVIGANVLVGPNVTIGGRSGHQEVPVVGDDVFIGTGAKILGPIHVGSGSVIGANAVVIEDVPSRSVVAGVPARVIREDVDVNEYGGLPRSLGDTW